MYVVIYFAFCIIYTLSVYFSFAETSLETLFVTVNSITKLYFRLVLALSLKIDEDFSERSAEADIIFLKKPNDKKSTESMTSNSFKMLKFPLGVPNPHSLP